VEIQPYRVCVSKIGRCIGISRVSHRLNNPKDYQTIRQPKRHTIGTMPLNMLKGLFTESKNQDQDVPKKDKLAAAKNNARDIREASKQQKQDAKNLKHQASERKSWIRLPRRLACPETGVVQRRSC
jgi:hypothetical protein